MHLTLLVFAVYISVTTSTCRGMILYFHCRNSQNYVFAPDDIGIWHPGWRYSNHLW